VCVQTRVLVTHGVHWLPMVDQIVVIVNGQISEVGSYEELLSHDGAFAQFLKTYLTQEDEDDDDDDPESKLLHLICSI
jgi:ATP-binding cassette subfamily C (CFTR/MRP) protein 1